MKRDWTLIRKLLLGVESNSINPFKEYTQEQVEYHLYLLSDGGFIEDSTGAYRFRWRGVELLDSLRDEQTFNKVMTEIEERGIGLATEVLVGLIKQLP